MTTPIDLDFQIQRQPDDTTCGPTCLQAVYRHFGDPLPVDDLVAEVPEVEGGGTLGVLLARHALERGYKATILSSNLVILDPTWFDLERDALRARLLARAEKRAGDEKLAGACRAYARFLEAGGVLAQRDLEPALFAELLGRGLPVMAGLSASFLYREAREDPVTFEPDDVGGDATGHFVVLSGYDPASREVLVSDPLHPNPLAEVHTYPLPVERLIGAIYLGVLTYDCNLIVLEPPDRNEARK